MKKPRFDKWSAGAAGAAGAGGATAAAGWSAGRERERERERERRAQMAVPEPHDPHSLFGAPVRVSPSASDRVSQQIQMKLGDYRVACRLLDDPRSCPIGIYGEPASPAPVSATSRGSCEFKKPHHTPNGRPHHRLPSSLYSNKTSDGTTWPAHGQPAPPRFHNGTVQTKSIEPNTPQIENILKEMQALPSQPLSAMVATPRKEPDSIFHFNPIIATKIAEEPPATPVVDTKMPPPKSNLSGGLSSARLSPDVDKDLVVTDSEDEVKATDMLSPVGGGSSSGSESSPSDTDTDSSSDDSKPPDSAAGGASPARPASPPPLAAPPPVVAPPPAVGPPPPVAPAPSWSLSNFAPPAPAARAPDSDCYDSTREVENALASVKVNGQGPISSLSDSDASAKRSPAPAARRRRHHLPKPPPAPASSDDEPSPPTRSSDDEPAPAARKRTKRGRPPKQRPPPPPVQAAPAPPALDERCKKRGRPRKQRAARASSEEPRSESDAETPPPAVAPVTDKKKNDTLRKLFTIRKTEEGLGKGGAKGGKGKGQVVIVEAREEEEEEAAARRRRREEEEAAEEERRRTEELRARLRRREEDEAAAAAAAAEALAAAKRRVTPAPPAPAEETSRKRSRSTSGGAAPVEDALQRRLQEEAAATRGALMCRVDLSRLSAELGRQLAAGKARRRPPSVSSTNATPTQGPEPAPTNHERSESTAVYAGGGGRTPIYFSYFERLPQDCSVEEDRDHKYYLSEAMRLRRAAESETEPLPRLMLYLESVLCFVLTGRVLELQLDTKKAFTMYRETMEYIKSINSMPSRYRTSPHSTFGKLEILSLRVQALLYLRMFKMYKREVKECYKIVQDYQQKAACAATEPGAGVGTVSPLSPTPSPAGSVGSVGSAGSASSGYASAPPPPHHALTQLTNYYTFLYIAHELWEQADVLVRNTNNTELFISVDRTCGPLTLHSTFPHLVQYVRTAIARLKERH